MKKPNPVTPCVGVWIETADRCGMYQLPEVTPCVGVWIETGDNPVMKYITLVTPCVGVWIETRICFSGSP